MYILSISVNSSEKYFNTQCYSNPIRVAKMPSSSSLTNSTNNTSSRRRRQSQTATNNNNNITIITLTFYSSNSNPTFVNNLSKLNISDMLIFVSATINGVTYGDEKSVKTCVISS